MELLVLLVLVILVDAAVLVWGHDSRPGLDDRSWSWPASPRDHAGAARPSARR